MNIRKRKQYENIFFKKSKNGGELEFKRTKERMKRKNEKSGRKSHQSVGKGRIKKKIYSEKNDNWSKRKERMQERMKNERKINEGNLIKMNGKHI